MKLKSVKALLIPFKHSKHELRLCMLLIHAQHLDVFFPGSCWHVLRRIESHHVDAVLYLGNFTFIGSQKDSFCLLFQQLLLNLSIVGKQTSFASWSEQGWWNSISVCSLVGSLNNIIHPSVWNLVLLVVCVSLLNRLWYLKKFKFWCLQALSLKLEYLLTYVSKYVFIILLSDQLAISCASE